ncbi:MAG: hypothetical protein DWQ02_20965 [Bacteroidetes bacterium]|nr:MAG: hypothetical protein DWQ02_20965 [Bacteroidota bacterium]
MKYLLISTLLLAIACSPQQNSKAPSNTPENLTTFLDTIWQMEQEPISIRDSLIKIYGAESAEAAVYQKIYKENHAVNIQKIRNLLDTHGWPDTTINDTQGNHTICNVLQHSEQETREHYIPLMKQAVLDQKLEARFLVRAQDRLATDKGELQIYGGQMKYYPETKSFNVWPVYDPANIDKRRAEIGLGPIAEFLKNRFDFEWDLEEQIKRTEEFESERLQENE